MKKLLSMILSLTLLFAIYAPVSAATYVTATDKDFLGNHNGGFKYIGTADYIIIPDTIKGKQVTSYRSMFANTDIKGVIADNPNVTDMRCMFSGCSSPTLELDLNTSSVTDMRGMFSYSGATTLDLSCFDTSKVTRMDLMFWGAEAKSLDLTSFNTSRVTDMSQMFYDCKATSLILTSFNTSSVTDMTSMFNGCKAKTLDLSSFDTSKAATYAMFFHAVATTGYARTQSDINRYNAINGHFSITDKPASLTFKIK